MLEVIGFPFSNLSVGCDGCILQAFEQCGLINLSMKIIIIRPAIKQKVTPSMKSSQSLEESGLDKAAHFISK